VESYLELYRTGKFKPPSPDTIKKWMVEYGLSADKFAELIGVTTRRFYRYLRDNDDKEHLDMDYSEVRYFLTVTGQAEPERRTDKYWDFFINFRLKLKEMNISTEEFSKEYLGFSRGRFYQLKKEDPDKLEELIRSKINIEW